MKRVILASVLMFSWHSAFSQEIHPIIHIKKLTFGFNLGVNYSNLLAGEIFPANASVSNDIGFRLGALANIHLEKFLSISPKIEISINNSKVDFTNTAAPQNEYKVMPVTLDLMSHFVIRAKRRHNITPYFLIGPNIKIPVTRKSKNSTHFTSNSDFAFDLGIGLDKHSALLQFSPEIRYSLGMLNVNRHPSISSLSFHNLSLVINFRG